MTFIRSLALLLVTALMLALASPTSDPLTGELLARSNGGPNLDCGSHASHSAITHSQSNITTVGHVQPDLAKPIRIYWHVIYQDKTYSGGYLSKDQIKKQVLALNTHFHSAGISFKLEKIDHTHNPTWFTSVDNTNQDGQNMKTSLHLGGRDDLNVYSVGFQTTGLGGFSTFPWDYVSSPGLDGVVFKWDTTPGGTLPGYTQGKILVHEVGHWCGLYHTFQGGCPPPGDYVADTPPQAGPNFGCPIGADSCPGGGPDAIHNFMDYTNDPCKTNFTPGQRARMNIALSIWR